MSDPTAASASHLLAEPGDPRVGVHALSEFLYCQRAAILASEKDYDEDTFDRLTRADYVPLYFHENQIVARLNWFSRWMFAYLVVALASGGLAILMYAFQEIGWLAISAVVCSVALVRACARLADVLEVRAQWHHFQSASAVAPPEALSELMPVNWWQLRRAGFDLQYQVQLVDDRCNLGGRPWHVLRYGDLRIPVFRMRGESSTIRPQHLARSAAYCHLLETCEGARSPYGVVLLPRSYGGIAIPNAPANQQLFHDALLALRALLKGKRAPEAPSKTFLCKACPFGYPVLHRRGKTETRVDGVRLPVCAGQGEDGRTYHSPCGDRFEWLPSHDRAEEKKLRRN